RRPAGSRRRQTAAREGRAVQALDYAVALFSGALLALSFPKFGNPVCAWVSLAPLVIAVVRQSAGPRRAFRLGLATGTVYFGGTLYWLVETMTTFGGLAVPLAVLAAALL